MADGRASSVVLWRGKSLSCSTSFIEWVVIGPQRLKLLVLFLVNFCAFGFGFSSQGLRAEETAVPSATPAAQSNSGSSPTPTATPERPAVRWVGVRGSNGEKRGLPKAYAGRGDEIWVDVIN